MLSKILLIGTYIMMVVIVIVSLFVGRFMYGNLSLSDIDGERDNLEGVINKSYTFYYNLPSKEQISYFFRYQDGQVLVNQFFVKVKLSQYESAIIKDENYPQKIEDKSYFKMPIGESDIYIPVDNELVKKHVKIYLIYFTGSISYVLFVLFLLSRFLKNCTNGHYFEQSNAKILRLIAYSGIAAVIIHYLYQYFSVVKLIGDFESSYGLSLERTFNFNYTYIIISLILLVIAEAFKEGVKLKDENSLTI